MTTSRDLVFLALAAGLVILLALAGWLARRWITGFLTPREWRIAGKLVAIGLLWFLLLMTSIAREFPASLFLYGRF